MWSVQKIGRGLIFVSFLLIQVSLFGQYNVSMKASERQQLCSFHSQAHSSGDEGIVGKVDRPPFVSPYSIGCQYSHASDYPRTKQSKLKQSNMKSNSSATRSSISFQDLEPNSGVQYERYKYRAPSIYPNVNYTIVQELARPYEVWKLPFPCFPAEADWYSVQRQKSATKQGFFYFKARKAGSSTVAGVALRIARSKAQAIGLQATSLNATHCHTRYGHPAAHRLHYHNRDRNNSFLWSVIREPTKRDISEFFHFAVSRGAKMEPSRQAFQAYYEWTPHMHEYYLQFMPTDKSYEMGGKGQGYVRSVAKIMTDYDFIGITERMHESLVALQLLLDLQTSDILFLSAKTSGGWDDGLSNGQCYYIHPPIISPQLAQHFQSDAWREKTKGGNLLYVAANRSLDLTIASFDQPVFQQKLKLYKWALQEAQVRCQDKVRFPCSAGGVRQKEHDCLLWDSGCGYDCLDRVAHELGV